MERQAIETFLQKGDDVMRTYEITVIWETGRAHTATVAAEHIALAVARWMAEHHVVGNRVQSLSWRELTDPPRTG